MAIGEISTGGTIIGGMVGQRGAQGVSITGVSKTSTTDLVDTYTITYSNGNTSTFDVTNGAKGDTGATGATGTSITNVSYTSSSGLVDTYTITFSNGSTSTFTITNGTGVSGISYTSSSGLVDTYTISYTDGNSSTFTITNGTTFTPSVDASGNISWTNDGGKVNPTSRNIKGATGNTPSLSIGNVSTGSSSSASITGTTENPVLNLTLEKGEQGEQGEQGIQGETGNGIASIEKTGTAGLVDTYTITYTDGDTDTFDVTNGADGNVTDVEVDGTSVVDNGVASINGIGQMQTDLSNLQMLENAIPKVTDEDETITLDKTAQYPLKYTLKGNTSQFSTTGKNLLPITATGTLTHNGITFKTNSDGSVIVSGTASGGNAYAALTTNGYFESNSIYGTGKQIMNVNGTYTYSSNNSSVGVLIVESDDTSYSFLANGTGNRSFTYTGTIRVALKVAEGTAITNPITIYPMLEKSASATSYEPYTGGNSSPNPDYPQDIHIVSGDNTIKICGKNLWVSNNYSITNNSVKFTYNQNGTIKANGTATANATSITIANAISNNIYITLQAGTYTASCNNLIAGVSLQVYDTNSNEKTTTFTLTQTTNIVLRLKVNNGTILDNNVFNIQLEKGSTSSEYEANQSQLISLGVENLFDKDNATYKNSKYINNSGYEVDSTISGYTTSYVSVIPNTTYTIQGKIRKDTSYNGSIYFYDTSKTFITRTGWGGENLNYFTFTTPNNCYYIRFQYAMEIYDATTVQIEIGSKTNSYSSYGATPIELCKIATYQDYIYKSNDKWYLHKKIDKIIFDGTEDWTASSTYLGSYYLTSSKTTLKPTYTFAQLFSDKFTRANIDSGSQVSSNYHYGTCFIETPTGAFNCWWGDSTTTLNDFKTWLTNNNVILYYPLQNAEEIEITDTRLISQLETILYSYQGQTNISQVNNDKPFIINASALYDLSDLVTRVATLETE